ncbi:hypothetical protein OH492_12480 [Vibrio chagasii]|nr:hypothetical protein [Vibrio chagasii]
MKSRSIKGSHHCRALSEYSKEAEVLFAPNAHFRITQIERTSTHTYIGVETLKAPAINAQIPTSVSSEEVEASF